RDAKLDLAFEIVKIYHGEEAAQKAKNYFINTFSKRKTPDDILVVPSSAPEISIVDYIVETKLAKSKSDARRKIEQGGVELDGKKVEDWKMILNSEVHNDMTLKVGKFSFVKIKF
ncbi:tyrosine--tRNA ligase, partial [Patescibacteria group bacterium]|nr:tyrosine--tRNA ligase [Patescibacteria group bacterium]